VNLTSSCNSFDSNNKNISFHKIISYFLDKSLERRATLHTRAFSLQDSRNFEKARFNFQKFHIKNNFLTKFEKSRLLALHTLIFSLMACSLFFIYFKQ